MQPKNFSLDVTKNYLEAPEYIAFRKAPSLKAPEENLGKHLTVMPEEEVILSYGRRMDWKSSVFPSSPVFCSSLKS